MKCQHRAQDEHLAEMTCTGDGDYVITITGPRATFFPIVGAVSYRYFCGRHVYLHADPEDTVQPVAEFQTQLERELKERQLEHRA